jgi:O-antigen ligase
MNGAAIPGVGMSGAPPVTAAARPSWPGTLLFMAMSLFLWISVTPFVDLSDPHTLNPMAGTSNPVYQVVLIALSGATLVYGLTHPMRSAILQPRALVGGLLLWFLLTSLLGSYPMLGIKAIVVVALVTANAGNYLLLPGSERHFARMICLVMFITLGVAYFGIVFKPTLSIHQFSELLEPMNAGLWRGHFNHKNTAAAAMVIAAFLGLYVMGVWSRPAGLVIIVLATLFLVNTGGKTSIAMLPAALLAALLFEKMRWIRVPMVVGGILGFNFLVVGAAVIRPVNEFIASFGIDATFTNRADIWRLAVDAIARNPITGYGLKGFWQTEELVYSGSVETWATVAGHGHNSYIDLILTTGVPGLVLTLIWVVFLPLRDISRLEPQQASTPLTRLFTRIWLFALFNAGLESVFFEGRNIVWFMLVVALAGLRLQSRAVLQTGTQPRALTRMAAHA